MLKRKAKYRSIKILRNAEQELYDKIWYDRHQMYKELLNSKNDPQIAKNLWPGAHKTEKNIEKRYGKKSLGPWSGFEWGMLNGKLSALRWALGSKWDKLDIDN